MTMLTRERAVQLSVGEAALPPRGRAVQRYSRLAFPVAATDVLSLMVAVGLAWIATFGLAKPQSGPDFEVLFAPLLFPPIYAAFRLYDLSRVSPAEEFRRIPAAVSLGISALVLLGFWSGAGFPREWIAFSWLFSLILALASRRIWHWWMAKQRVGGALAFRTLIVGTSDEARRIADAMNDRQLGFDVVGFASLRRDYVRLDGRRVYEADDLTAAIAETGADCVFVASTDVTPDEMARISKAARLEGAEVRVSANLAEILASRLTVQTIGNLLALSLRPAKLSGSQAVLKRGFDLVVATLAILLTSPVWLVAAVAVKLTSRGPILFRQERLGRDARRFRIYKLRTMVVDAEAKLQELNPDNGDASPLFKIKNDPRVTKIGKFLRKWSIDELPQLLNVVKGDMSLVGPRPMPAVYDESFYKEWHRGRFEVLPGITGLWQISGRSQLTFDECVRLDLFYIENWSIAYDLYILAETLPAVFFRKGAY